MNASRADLEKDKADVLFIASECVSDHGKAECKALGGECVIERDGYYIVSTSCIIIGIIVFTTFIRPTALALQGMTMYWLPRFVSLISCFLYSPSNIEMAPQSANPVKPISFGLPLNHCIYHIILPHPFLIYSRVVGEQDPSLEFIQHLQWFAHGKFK